MAEPFREMLTGGHPNSLGRTEEVVGTVLEDHARLEELFATLGDEDAVVRLRAGDALEKVCRERPDWLEPHTDRVLREVGAIEQPSVRWHVAQILDHLHDGLAPDQLGEATELLKRNLSGSSDWIVLNVTMEVLVGWARGDPALRRWLLAGELDRLATDGRRSVARRATRLRDELSR